MDDELREKLNAGSGAYFSAGSLLARIESACQLIEVYDTPQWGRLLRLDGCNMTSEGDEFVYHENLIHPAALAHAAPQRALIVGGGDGGAAEELLKHPTIESVTLAELDPAVVEAAKKYLQQVHRGAFADSRLELKIGDGAAFLRELRSQYDLIALDLTDPGGPAAALYTAEFFASCQRALRPGGVLSLHLGSPYYQPERFGQNLRDLSSVFAIVRPYLVFVPIYGALWGFATASDTLDPRSLSPAQLDTVISARKLDDLRYCNGEALHAGFALPVFVQALVSAGKINRAASG
jgi:spermidine synthase